MHCAVLSSEFFLAIGAMHCTLQNTPPRHPQRRMGQSRLDQEQKKPNTAGTSANSNNAPAVPDYMVIYSPLNRLLFRTGNANPLCGSLQEEMSLTAIPLGLTSVRACAGAAHKRRTVVTIWAFQLLKRRFRDFAIPFSSDHDGGGPRQPAPTLGICV